MTFTFVLFQPYLLTPSIKYDYLNVRLSVLQFPPTHYLGGLYPFITYMTDYGCLVRPQKLVNGPLSLVYPFPLVAWILVAVATILSLLTALLFAYVYRRCQSEDLVLVTGTWEDISFKIMGSLTEPDFLGFFPMWTAGNHEYEVLKV